MWLNLGCGNKKLEGYVNIDIDQSVQPDMVDDVVKLKGFGNCEIDKINASHLIEHLSYSEFDEALHRWFTILKHNGTIVLECPDFEALFKAFVDADEKGKWNAYNYTWHSLNTYIFGNQTTEYQFHKSAFTKTRLATVLGSVGFNQIQFLTPDYPYCPCIKVQATKP